MNTVLARFLPGHADRDAAAVHRERRELQQVTFPDLAWDHFHWEQERRTGSCEHPKAASRYRQTRAAFEARHGEIVSEYWSIVEPSGVALTFRKARRGELGRAFPANQVSSARDTVTLRGTVLRSTPS